VALAAVIVTVVSTAHASTVRRSPVTITHVSVRGHVAKVTLRVRGWGAGARVRIFVDGKYNNFSRMPTLALAVNLGPGKHRISADRVLKGRHSIRSRTSKITVRRSTGTLIAAAGDIACDPESAKFNRGRGTAAECHMAATARLITGMRPKLVLPLGDLQYDCGSADAYMRSYRLSWGKFRLISRPVAGNHEYGTEGTPPSASCAAAAPGAGYYSYFGALAGGPGGYYSYDVGGWHVIALNSECGFVGGCGTGSPQESWLRADLAAHVNQCTLAYWHRPRWSGTGAGAGDASFDAFWKDLAGAGTELVLNGHRHLYLRLAPLGPTGAPDAAGIRQLVVGTGGVNLFGQGYSSDVATHNQAEYGALALTLRTGSYEWQFVPEAGGVYTDYGTASCH